MRTWKARVDTTRHGTFVLRGSDIQTSDTEALDPALFELVDDPPVVVPEADAVGDAADPVTAALKLAEAGATTVPDAGQDAGQDTGKTDEAGKPDAGQDAGQDAADKDGADKGGKSGAKGSSKK